MRVRLLRPAVTKYGVLLAGQSAEVPTATATSWIAAGLAEQDKALDGAPETK